MEYRAQLLLLESTEETIRPKKAKAKLKRKEESGPKIILCKICSKKYVKVEKVNHLNFYKCTVKETH